MSETVTLHIRRAVPADAAELARCMAEWFMAAYAHASDATNTAKFVAANFAAEKQAAEIVAPDIVTLIAEADGAMVGYAQVRFATTPHEAIVESDPAELGRFYFAPSQHGRGGAAQLMRAVRAAARERGRRWLWLLVWQEAPQAIRFYEKNGFEKAGTAVFMVGDDRKADWVMRAKVDA
ncbi:MAG TPA: GNAT family N-acetyltransferase [Tahibacter sp.]|uniref:GNAT family N-acetyltransferase n=1 Tax=Tahibacter sp. TaxID=2056211 RepID=UPI002C4584E6|nr:GNAT family N-acetyltransferase [Tahibacter sp.]HSX60123.1 GNAT family N-acetyltransferase [Tahibacter sp.]